MAVQTGEILSLSDAQKAACTMLVSLSSMLDQDQKQALEGSVDYLERLVRNLHMQGAPELLPVIVEGEIRILQRLQMELSASPVASAREAATSLAKIIESLNVHVSHAKYTPLQPTPDWVSTLEAAFSALQFVAQQRTQAAGAFPETYEDLFRTAFPDNPHDVALLLDQLKDIASPASPFMQLPGHYERFQRHQEQPKDVGRAVEACKLIMAPEYGEELADAYGALVQQIGATLAHPACDRLPKLSRDALAEFCDKWRDALAQAAAALEQLQQTEARLGMMDWLERIAIDAGGGRGLLTSLMQTEHGRITGILDKRS